MKNNRPTLIPPVMAIARSISYYEDDDVLNWARTSNHLDLLVDDADVAKLLSTNNKRADSLDLVSSTLNRIVQRHWPEFQLSGDNSSEIAQSFFELRLWEYLEQKCEPWAVCRMIQPIEQIFEYPSWLGSMYDACDWIEYDYEPSNCRHLAEHIREHLASKR